MIYNVGPDHTRESVGPAIRCECGCSVLPIWSGHDGIWQCPECYADLENYEEDSSDETR